jgi:hypothetical protein
VQFFQDTEVKRLFAGAEDFGFHSSACVFSADVVTRVDVPTPTDRVRWIGIYKVPRHMLPIQFKAEMGALIDRCVALPIWHQNVLKHTTVRMWATIIIITTNQISSG